MRTVAVVAALLALWWLATAPRPEVAPAPSIAFAEDTVRAMMAVDRSQQFASSLQSFPSDLPGHDDIVFVDGGAAALVSAMDGRLWKVDLRTHAAEPFLDPPLMPSGMHEAPGDPSTIYLCASHLHGQTYPAGEAVGLYRLDVATRAVTPVVLRVPATAIEHARPVIYRDDGDAPELAGNASGGSRPLAFCNDLELSQDGRRIYFSEPFSYEGASMGGGALVEAVSLAANGRLWRHDLDTGVTRLIAEGYHFIDGVLFDLHPGKAREESVLVSQTPQFRLTRFFIAGARAGTAQVVLDGLGGMPDGLDRDDHGRIWAGLIKERSALLTWLHANAWIKPLFLRLPLERVPQSRRTGVVVLSADGSTPLYAAMYEGPALSNIASAVPGPQGVYLTPFDPEHRGLVRLPYPALPQ
ncbi:MAG TPA: hypothetical protein VEC57_12120 [Candidatus Limnocylindrales bacterium]|nr:hypothetical protein [Candidatus Limnocylindrales bacterium]